MIKVTVDLKWVLVAGVILLAGYGMAQAMRGGGFNPFHQHLPHTASADLSRMSQHAQDKMAEIAAASGQTVDQLVSNDTENRYEQIAYATVKQKMMNAAVRISVSGDINAVESAYACLQPLVPTTTTISRPTMNLTALEPPTTLALEETTVSTIVEQTTSTGPELTTSTEAPTTTLEPTTTTAALESTTTAAPTPTTLEPTTTTAPEASTTSTSLESTSSTVPELSTTTLVVSSSTQPAPTTTLEASTTTLSVRCSVDNDCGSPVAENPYCAGGVVYQVVRTYSCLNPGTTQAACNESIENSTLQACIPDKVCNDGRCETTTTNTDH